MKLVTSAQMRSLEQRSDTAGNTYAMMMERAGRAVADALIARLGLQEIRQTRVLVLVGPGNNGGDGLVCARYLFDAGAPVSLYIWKRARKDTDENWRLCDERNIPVTHAESDRDFAALRGLLAQSDVLVDALLGTGVSKLIDGVLKDLLGVVKENLERKPENDLDLLIPPLSGCARRRYVVAVDLPSGLNPDTGAIDPATVPADLTVTFAFAKIGQATPPGALAIGELVVADIGIKREWAAETMVEVASADEVAARLPVRSRESHKGTFGKAMICAGSANYVGAAFLAGAAAARAGTGLVTLAIARTIYPMIASASHETTFVPLPDEDGGLVPDAVEVLLNALADYDALLVGSGFGRRPKTIDFVERLLGVQPTSLPKGPNVPSAVPYPLLPGATPPPACFASGPHCKLPRLVIDADALHALSRIPGWWSYMAAHGYSAILTPHPGEMAGLCGLKPSEVQSDRIRVAQKFAAQWHQVVVLKGAYTVVAEPDGRAMVIPFATSALATAGTGDVLAGTITAFLAQQLAPFDAAVTGAYVHGLAGLLAEREIGAAGVLAGDLLPRLPAAMARVRQAAI